MLSGLEDLAEDYETVVMGIPDIYGRLLGKRFDKDHFVNTIATSGNHFCTYLLGCDLGCEQVPGLEYCNWDKGYGDFHVVPDMTTLRKFAWLDNTAGVIGDVLGHDDEPVPVAPRNILKNVLKKASEMGFSDANCASELECMMLQGDMKHHVATNFTDLKPAGTNHTNEYNILGEQRSKGIPDMFENLQKTGIEMEAYHGEATPCQHEFNVRYQNALKMADDTVVLKHCIKQTAQKNDLTCTFMPKFDNMMAGQSCHIHISMLDADGNNAFAGDEKICGDKTGSPTLKHFIAGWLKYTPDLMPFFVPTINGYKRLQPGTWAPNTLTWADQNRTCGFRLVGEGKGIHLETRVPGGDCNAYLGFSAAIIAGLAGIEDKLFPADEFKGNAYEITDPELLLPSSLSDALEKMRNSDVAKRWLGEDVVEHYYKVLMAQVEMYERTVHSWELEYYFDQI